MEEAVDAVFSGFYASYRPGSVNFWLLAAEIRVLGVSVKLRLILISCCILVRFSFAQSPASENQNRKPLSIESIFAQGGITGRGPENLKWSPDNTKLTFVQRDDSGDHGELWYIDAATGEKKVLVSEMKLATLSPPINKIKDEREKERLSRYHVAAYVWAPDSKRLLFDSQGQLWLYDITSGTAVQVTSAADPSGDPKFSPDGNLLAYVRKHNLYVRPVNGRDEKALTKDTDANLLNGEVDWLYAEELSVRSNYFWSPDGKNIAFLQSNETQVPSYPITDWLPTHPSVDMEKYPKAGDPNPVVRLGVVSASGGKTKFFSLTKDNDVYMPHFGWVHDGLLWAQVLNRTQDKMDLYFVDAHSGKSRIVLTESIPDGWVKVNDDFRVLKSGDRFLWSSWRDGNTHLYLYSFNKQSPLDGDAKLEIQLTKGDFQVLGVETVDDAAGVVYFSCNKDDPRQKQLYSVKLDGSGFMRASQTDGTHDSTFADDGKHYADDFSALLKPPQLSLCSTGGSCKEVWDSRSVEPFGLLPPKFLEFKAEDGTTLYGELLLPPAGKGNTKIPLIVNVYGGPAAQLVRNEWIGTTGLFHQLLAWQGYAVFSVDNRGTPNRDRKFETAIRHQFGAIELKDQTAALDQLLAEVPQLDRNRVAMWGWSNGASMTLYSLTHSDLFKAGVAVAPVTDWHNYDTAYTERYMGLPKDNLRAYELSSIPRAADKLNGSLLLVHGTSDDNVHFQNTIQMVDALIKSGKQFRLMVYPGKTHGIGGSDARDHLFHMIQDHFDAELK
ncbi:MAG TPA: DPP IV N-terminal domain-containing protein [Terriglobales bacterium]|nr:DPP IV N-terminal domain-containing protein [Terriglobales bacterium]